MAATLPHLLLPVYGEKVPEGRMRGGADVARDQCGIDDRCDKSSATFEALHFLSSLAR
jgi:hypothetical protein